ncbi:glycosyltransferase [Candidatus Uhrbacteria bacterium]|nr:glycosyltransferase [Candidatus Uhrbacteria bacterium]
MTKVTAIIPAYDEEVTIGTVVSVVKASPFIQEVIVVSDGSSDRTGHVARAAGARVHELFPNSGKGEAMRFGVTQTDAPIVVFFDADLIGLNVDHIERLVAPVVDGACAMNVGLRDRGRWITSLTKHLPLISGERAMQRSVFEGVPGRFLHGFMIESALNYFCRSRGAVLCAVKLPGLTIRRKYQKVGILRAVLQYARMSYQIVKAMVVVRVAHIRKRL